MLKNGGGESNVDFLGVDQQQIKQTEENEYEGYEYSNNSK